MNGHVRTRGWAAALFVLLIAAVVGLVAYRIGVAHGLAMHVTGPEAEGARGLYPYGYGWYGPWGFGFPFFGFFFPFLFFGLWFLAFRFLFWGGPWRRRWYHSDEGRVPRAFDEWHRRAHEQMRDHPSAPPTSGA